MWGGEDVGNARHKNHSYSTLIIISPCLGHSNYLGQHKVGRHSDKLCSAQ